MTIRKPQSDQFSAPEQTPQGVSRRTLLKAALAGSTVAATQSAIASTDAGSTRMKGLSQPADVPELYRFGGEFGNLKRLP